MNQPVDEFIFRPRRAKSI